jgi:hypothetical protein
VRNLFSFELSEKRGTYRIYYMDSVFLYKNTEFWKVEKVTYGGVDNFLNYVEMASNSDTLSKDTFIIKYYTPLYDQIDYWVIRKGKVQKYFSYEDDYYYYLAKGQKKYKNGRINSFLFSWGEKHNEEEFRQMEKNMKYLDSIRLNYKEIIKSSLK